MKELKMNYRESVTDYPEAMSKMLGDLILSDPTAKLEEVDIYYYWTILPTSFDQMDEYKHLLFYSERLEYEMDKVIVEIYIRHRSYIRGEDVSSYIKPSIIKDELSQIIVTSMLYEQMVYHNEDVIDSIPNDISSLTLDLSNNLLPMIKQKGLKDIHIEQLEEVYTLDEILEKISSHGIDKLSHNEKKILDDLSKS